MLLYMKLVAKEYQFQTISVQVISGLTYSCPGCPSGLVVICRNLENPKKQFPHNDCEINDTMYFEILADVSNVMSVLSVEIIS